MTLLRPVSLTAGFNATPLKGVIFDWAGTTIDYGSRAPTMVFAEVFHRKGIAITEAEARGPMGKAKRDHIASVLFLPRVAAAWETKYGRAPTDDDVQSMYIEFLPLQKEILASYSTLIPGAAEVCTDLRSLGLKIGSSTGYTRELMEVVLPLAAQQGYAPDATVCSDEVRSGRPDPWLNFRVAEQLGVYPMSSVMIVDDTPLGIEAGLRAGCITVAVTKSGNALGLSAQQAEALSQEEWNDHRIRIEKEFAQAGAHAVIESIAELPALIRTLL